MKDEDAKTENNAIKRAMLINEASLREAENKNPTNNEMFGSALENVQNKALYDIENGKVYYSDFGGKHQIFVENDLVLLTKNLNIKNNDENWNESDDDYVLVRVESLKENYLVWYQNTKYGDFDGDVCVCGETNLILNANNKKDIDSLVKKGWKLEEETTAEIINYYAEATGNDNETAHKLIAEKIAENKGEVQ